MWWIGAEVEDPTDEVAESASSLWETALEAIPRVGIALGVIVIGWVVSRLVRAAFRRAVIHRRSLSFARVMSKIAGWVVLFVVVLIAMTITFPSVKPVDVLAGLGFFSVAIGFAFQDILENTLAGVLLLFRQPFAAGDQIEVSEQIGTVEGITIRETRLTTFDGQLVIIPNRDVYKNVIRVQTANPLLRSDFLVGIAYENDAGEAERVMMEALREVDGVAAEPAPMVLVTNLGVSTIDLQVRIWSPSRQLERLGVVDRAIRACKRALDDAGIEMPADIVALQATPSFKAALHGDADLTPGGSVKS